MNEKATIKTIEHLLGNYRKLPEYPFSKEGKFAVFATPGDFLVGEKLYEALFSANISNGNSSFIIQASHGLVDEKLVTIEQKVLDWKSFDEFQFLPLSYQGFYLTGDSFNWLAIYHRHNYLVIGANEQFVRCVCEKICVDSDWKDIFCLAYENGEVDIYPEDFEVLEEKLIKSEKYN